MTVGCLTRTYRNTLNLPPVEFLANVQILLEQMSCVAACFGVWVEHLFKDL